ncbi:MAG: PEP-CTERM sorting domain-containing protein [Planctomycetota bacterium]
MSTSQAAPIVLANSGSLSPDAVTIDFETLADDTKLETQFQLSLGLEVFPQGGIPGAYVSSSGSEFFSGGGNNLFNRRGTPLDGEEPSTLIFAFDLPVTQFAFVGLVADTSSSTFAANSDIELVFTFFNGDPTDLPSAIEVGQASVQGLGVSDDGNGNAEFSGTFVGFEIPAGFDFVRVDPIETDDVSTAFIRLDDLTFTTLIPEPASLGLVVLGVGLMAARRRREE